MYPLLAAPLGHTRLLEDAALLESTGLEVRDDDITCKIIVVAIFLPSQPQVML
jgi:hypothetical protein